MCGETVLPSHRHKRLYPPDLGSIYEEPLSFCCWSPPGIVTWSCWTRPFWKVLWKAIRFQPGEVCPGFKREVLLKFSLLFFLCVAFFFCGFGQVATSFRLCQRSRQRHSVKGKRWSIFRWQTWKKRPMVLFGLRWNSSRGPEYTS